MSSFTDVKKFIREAGYKVESAPGRHKIYVKSIKTREEGIQLANLLMSTFPGPGVTPLWTDVDRHFGLTVYVG